MFPTLWGHAHCHLQVSFNIITPDLRAYTQTFSKSYNLQLVDVHTLHLTFIWLKFFNFCFVFTNIIQGINMNLTQKLNGIICETRDLIWICRSLPPLIQALSFMSKSSRWRKCPIVVLSPPGMISPKRSSRSLGFRTYHLAEVCDIPINSHNNGVQTWVYRSICTSFSCQL